MPDDAASTALRLSTQVPAAQRPTALRRTPCIGICSTTYGDLVCRGCNRFAHEIVGWNGYDDRQRALVWQRLHRLLAQSVRAHLRIVDEARLRAAAAEAAVCEAAPLPEAEPLPEAAPLPLEVLAFQTLRRNPVPLEMLGLAPRETTASGPKLNTRETLQAIDREFHRRSRAHYEAAFKTHAT